MRQERQRAAHAAAERRMLFCRHRGSMSSLFTHETPSPHSHASENVNSSAPSAPLTMFSMVPASCQDHDQMSCITPSDLAGSSMPGIQSVDCTPGKEVEAGVVHQTNTQVGPCEAMAYLEYEDTDDEYVSQPVCGEAIVLSSPDLDLEESPALEPISCSGSDCTEESFEQEWETSSLQQDDLEDETEEVVSRLSDASLVVSVASMLTQLCEQNKEDGTARLDKQVDSRLGVFFSREKFPFSLDSYVERVVANVQSRSAVIIALIYIDRLFMASVDMALTMSNLYKVLIAAIVLATKYLEDEPFAQEFYRQVGGLSSVDELNTLEAEFLNQIKWRTYVSREQYNTYYNAVCNRMIAMLSEHA